MICYRTSDGKTHYLRKDKKGYYWCNRGSDLEDYPNGSYFSETGLGKPLLKNKKDEIISRSEQ